ncbi:MAG: leucine-rich repeat protein [Okeania sp. SIO2D1]|nr:leucine-rich repeat protein [Okeania sp. SIO2D1]
MELVDRWIVFENKMEQHIKEQHLADILAKIQEANDKNKHFLSLDGELSQLNDDQEITEILTKIGELEHLEWLDLSNNQLTKIPAELFANLIELRQLDLSHNQLTTIPESITKRLYDLKRLNLSHNQFTAIPESITNFDDLTELDLSHNQLTTIPGSITNFDNLTELIIYGNNKLLTSQQNIVKKQQEVTQAVLEQIKEKSPSEISNLEPLNNCKAKKNAIRWEGLKFRSKPEVEIAKELDKRRICFTPNSGMRITTAKGRKTKETDFLIFYNKKYAILEVDGPFHTPKTRREEQEIEADFENHGIRIFRFDADECSKNPSAVVDKFLERLNNI